jgi:hypothetical protein
MRATMLMEIWERLRGYASWTRTQAQIEFLKEEHLYHDEGGKELHYSHLAGNRLVWTDSNGIRHHTILEPYGDPAKCPFTDGETVDLRYNPADPEQFYSRKLSEMKVRRFFATTFTVITVAAISIGYVWIKEMLGCSR